jgi:hypothetical protein
MLEAQNVAMAAMLDSEAIKMGGVTFQSLQDCQTWVMSNICPAANFYELYDTISLLEQYKDTTIPYTQMADTDTKTQKLGRLTVTSHRVINLFSREVPLIFMTGAASADKPLTKTPKEWDLGDGSTGLKNEISTFLDGSVEGMGQRITVVTLLAESLPIVFTLQETSSLR